MRSNYLTGNAETLFACAEELADMLGEERLSIEPHAEARLRAALAAATYAHATFVAMRDGAQHSDVPRMFVCEARRKCIRTERALRIRMEQLIGQIQLRIDENDDSNLAEYVLSLSA